MLEQLREELYVIIGLDGDLTNLSDPEKVAKSQELDVEINKEMHNKMLKQSDYGGKCKNEQLK